MKSVGQRTYLAAVLPVLLLSAAAGAEEPKVTITGGLQPDGAFYKWEVTNHASSPVVSIEFPHYQADQFPLPDELRLRGWKTKCTYLVNVGVEDRPGTCRVFAESPSQGIPRGGRVSITMRVRQLESRQGRGIVKVRFADGQTLEIGNVEVPCVPGYFERFGHLITLAILIGLAALVLSRRRRRQQRAEAIDDANGPDGGEAGSPAS